MHNLSASFYQKVNMREENFLNYIFICNKAYLSVNNNKYLLNNKIGWIKYKKFTRLKNNRYLFLWIVIAVFIFLKYVLLSTKIQNLILNLKLNRNYKIA